MIRPRPRRAMNQINVVPYIDVMLVLLVIFMVTAPFINPSQVSLPSVGKSSHVRAFPMEVIIHANGSLWLRNRAESGRSHHVSEARLADAIRLKQRRHPEQPVVISADKSVRYEAVMRVMDRLQKLGVPHIGLLVKPAQS